jgi:hypothetical protein
MGGESGISTSTIGLPLESRTPPVGRIATAKRSVFHVHDASLYPLPSKTPPMSS